MRLIFLDTETTGLDLDQHEIWEVGCIVRDNAETDSPTEDTYHWFLPVDLSKADLIALNIGKFFERYPTYAQAKNGGTLFIDPLVNFADEFMATSVGAYLVGACVDFDAYRIAKILKKYQCVPAWNYHLIDVENLIAGKLGIQPPWKSEDILPKIGIEIDESTKHTALGDAEKVKEVYDIIMGVKNGAGNPSSS